MDNSNSETKFGSLGGTPGFALSNMPPAATDFIQAIERPSQLDLMAGKADPFKDDPVAYNAIMAGRTALTNGAAKIRALSSDLTRSEPQRHEAGGVVSAKTVEALEETQHVLNARANAYQAVGDEALREAFPVKAEDKWVYDRWLSFLEREVVNEDGGLANIRKATMANASLATVITKMPAELMPLKGEFLTKLKADVIATHHPNIGEAFARAGQMRELAGKYMSLAARVKLNFHSPLHASKMKTRVEV